jgi:hypothetical protein
MEMLRCKHGVDSTVCKSMIQRVYPKTSSTS